MLGKQQESVWNSDLGVQSLGTAGSGGPRL